MRRPPQDDDEDWSVDRFGNHKAAGDTRYFQPRTSEKFNPIDNETVTGYIRRLLRLIKEQEDINTSAHIYGRKMWFTHKTPSECWICNEINIMWIQQEVMQRIANILPHPDNTVFKYDANNKLTLIDTLLEQQ